MIRVFTFFIGLIFTGSAFSQATTLLFEDFQGVFPSGWSTVNNDGLTPDTSVSFITDAWVLTEDLDNPGVPDSVITSTSWYDPVGTSDDWLISPAITLGSFGNKMSFNAKSYDASFPDGFQVFASQFNVIDSFIAHDTLLDISAQPTSWTTYEISLDSFALTGQTIYLAFRNNSTDQFLLSLDSIYVGRDHPVSSSEITKEDFSIYPNPATNQIVFNKWDANASYELWSIDGQLIGKLDNPNPDISFLSGGTYAIRKTINGQVTTKTFQKL